ncbi:MAG: hypothetical protein JWL84_4593 [Rhodospirillales bacterium]|nr:hypothetical protein [Rhodospirillales bacterium]
MPMRPIIRRSRADVCIRNRLVQNSVSGRPAVRASRDFSWQTRMAGAKLFHSGAVLLSGEIIRGVVGRSTSDRGELVPS